MTLKKWMVCASCVKTRLITFSVEGRRKRMWRLLPQFIRCNSSCFQIRAAQQGGYLKMIATIIVQVFSYQRCNFKDYKKILMAIRIWTRAIIILRSLWESFVTYWYEKFPFQSCDNKICDKTTLSTMLWVYLLRIVITF